LAFWTRLRRQEIKSLTWGNVRLDRHPPRIELRGHRTKSKRADAVVISQQLEAALREFWNDGIDAGERVIERMPSMKAFRADLQAARIPYDVDGLFADLHSLGKSFITACSTNNVGQRVAKNRLDTAIPA
jgi:integrase